GERPRRRILDRRHVDDLDPAVAAQFAAERARDLAELHAPPLAEAPRRRPTIRGPVRCSRAARAPLLRCPQTPSARSSALALGLPPFLIPGPVRCLRAQPRPLTNVHALGSPSHRRAC